MGGASCHFSAFHFLLHKSVQRVSTSCRFPAWSARRQRKGARRDRAERVYRHNAKGEGDSIKRDASNFFVGS